MLGKPSALRFFLIALIVPLTLLVAFYWLTARYERSEDIRQDAAQSFDRRVEQLDLLSWLKDAETAQRGYLLTGDRVFLQHYEPTRRAIYAQIATMRARSSPMVAPAYLPAMNRLVDDKFRELDRTIALFDGGQRDAAIRQVAAGAGRRTMEALRVLIGRMIDHEASTSLRQRQNYVGSIQRTQHAVAVAIAALFVLLCIGLYALWRLRWERYTSLVDALEAGERQAAILDGTIDAILILNPSGTVETVNAAATRMLGYPPDELERRDIATIMDLAPGEGSFHARVGLVDGRLRRSFLPDRSVRHRDGHDIAVDVAIGVLLVPSGDHLVVSLRDISERKRLERVKDELISTVSHELRTPLTSIVGSLGLLRGGAAGAMPPPAARLVEIAENNSRRLIRLINDMLDVDRIESGKLTIEQAQIDIRAVLEQACTGSEGLARVSDVMLECTGVEEPVLVTGDAERLLQVVTNLLSNAIRVSPAGATVVLDLAIDGRRAVMSVCDRGGGVPAEFRGRIFGRFERGPGDTSSSGTGLGLAISKEIVVRHGGTIWFEDREGGGTRFAFALPLAAAAARADDAAPTVLICEEGDDVARDLIGLVVAEGCAYERARSSAEARDMVTRRSYSALLIGLRLPHEGGLAFAQAVRHGDPAFGGPVIVVASAALGDGEAPSPLDVVDWIDKPADPERLTLALRTALARTNAKRPVILHLDDDRDLLDVVAAAIEPEGRIVSATDLASARAIVQEQAPDVAILDVRLADGSGLDLIPFLVDPQGLAIPTIIYSAQDVTPEQARRVDAVLIKARGSMPDLKATIRRVIRQRGEP